MQNYVLDLGLSDTVGSISYSALAGILAAIPSSVSLLFVPESHTPLDAGDASERGDLDSREIPTPEVRVGVSRALADMGIFSSIAHSEPPFDAIQQYGALPSRPTIRTTGQ